MLDQLLYYLHHNQIMQIIIPFGIALIESVPLLGSAIPGLLTIPPIGWMIATQQLPWHITTLCLIIGALLGDTLAYLIGSKYQAAILSFSRRLSLQHWLHTSEQFIHKYGLTSMILGRFIGPIRSIFPLLAGMFQMRSITFFITALVSILIWMTLHLLPGFLLAWYQIPTTVVVNGYQLLLSTFITFALLLMYHHAKDICYKLKQASIMITTKSFYIEKGIIIIALIGLLLNLYLQLNTPYLLRINQWINEYLTINQTHWIYTICLFIGTLLKPERLLCLGIILSIAREPKHIRSHIRPIILIITCFVIGFFVKSLVSFPRPSTAENWLGSYNAFPSGHTFMLMLLTYGYLKQRISIANTTGALVGVSRLLLGAHWFSDILGGIILGNIFITLDEMTISHNKPGDNNNSSSYIIGMAYFSLSLLAFIYRH
ncbi:MAG: VTT domain-containing protein [Pseudomonadota bacterium]|nr:VTT domain-containing protein [Pseudomonadota bacterium]